MSILLDSRSKWMNFQSYMTIATVVHTFCHCFSCFLGPSIPPGPLIVFRLYQLFLKNFRFGISVWSFTGFSRPSIHILLENDRNSTFLLPIFFCDSSNTSWLLGLHLLVFFIILGFGYSSGFLGSIGFFQIRKGEETRGRWNTG